MMIRVRESRNGTRQPQAWIRKRVRRTQELFGIALENPTHRLLLELELGAGALRLRGDRTSD
ncbi:hypothetical protein Psi01_81770 [Planobispora siamensis]|uniref:Uncharacterized protein n=1 Tax=Planobispora siamensis TaxID=936338 RepID=A0A8J3WR02_9ACTN|nr:hypothetical protein Psi01_81770 [Planobispora siamensis]